MSMTKYGTYRIFINPETQETKQVRIDSNEADVLEKSASWTEKFEEADDVDSKS
jgi:hypothetical protein